MLLRLFPILVSSSNNAEGFTPSSICRAISLRIFFKPIGGHSLKIIAGEKVMTGFSVTLPVFSRPGSYSPLSNNVPDTVFRILSIFSCQAPKD